MKYLSLTVLALSLVSSRLSAEDVSTDTLAANVDTSTNAVVGSTVPVTDVRVMRGIHLTASAAGSKKYRAKRLEPLLAQTMINTVVIDIKEEDGYVYVPGVPLADESHAYVRQIPDLLGWLLEMKKRHIYTVARIVVFKDNILPRKRPSMGVHQADGKTLWEDRKHITWLDPYNQDAWRYIEFIAVQCARSGFDEIQFDYIRFPTDGNLKLMRFSRPYSRSAASRALIAFLHRVVQVVHPLGVKVSIDVFGLTTSVMTGMGIGQVLGPMANEVDYVCPMTYPSHYARGEYGLANPNDQPYRTIHLAMRDALKILGKDSFKLRPYFQDFSLKGRGIRYGPKEIRAQFQAAADMGVPSWTLWNASCHYTLNALKEPIIPGTPITQIETPSHATSPAVLPRR